MSIQINNFIISNILSEIGYTNINGLTTNWNDDSNTLTLSFSSATNTSFPTIDYAVPSQADYTEVVNFVLNEIGYSGISGLSINWNTSINVLDFSFNSANLLYSGTNLYITNYTSSLDLDNYGNVSSFSSSGYNSTYGWLSYGTSDLTTYEKAIIKDAFVAINALESLSTATTTNDVATIALTALGYSNVSGLNISWNAVTQTSELFASSVYSSTDGWLYNVNIVVTTNSSGSITSYSSTGTTSSGYGFSFNQYNLDAAEVFVIEATNYALNTIDGINSNDTFTNGSATVVFDNAGNLIDYISSVTNSSIGTVTETENDLSSASVLLMEQGYDDITNINNDNITLNISLDSSVDGGAGIDNIIINHNFADMTMGVDANGTVVIKDANGNTTTITNVEAFEFSDQSFTAAALQANNDVRPLFASPQLENGTWVNSYILPDVFSSGNAGLDALYDYQFFGDTGGNILVASDKNDFINGFGGDDAINTGAGNDIIDGGLGSNFLTGGSGNDTFFSDGREVGNGAITWSTVTDFTAGTNSVNIWGYIDGTSTYEWYADAGATGWTGATLHADLDGNGTIDTSMTFTGLNVSEMNAPQGLEVGGNGYLLIG